MPPTFLDRPIQRPIVGVFVNHIVIRKLLKGRFQALRCYPRLSELSKASKEANVTLYFFSIKTCYLNRDMIKGTFYNDQEGIWQQEEFPLPDVLYDRRGGRKKYKQIAKLIRQFLDKRNTIKFNASSYFNKWDVYKKLQNIPEAVPYLPLTKLSNSEEDLTEFLEKFDTVYLKGVRGGQGKRVMRVVKLPNGGYECSSFVKEIIIEKVTDIKEVLNVVQDFFKGRKYIIQQGIKLLKVNDSNIDFRAEVQKNGNGEIEIVGISVRIAQQNSPITIHSNAYPIEEFFEKFTSYSKIEILNLRKIINVFLKTIYKSIESAIGSYGEIGIDFGIDASDKIWLIEPNSKSAKVSLQKAYDKNTFHRAFLNPLEYGKYLYRQAANDMKSDLSTEKEKDSRGGPVLSSYSINKIHIKSKLSVAYLLTNTPNTLDHIPATQLLGKGSFNRMLNDFPIVYIKSDAGSKGKGIIRVDRLGSELFVIRNSKDTVECNTQQAAWKIVNGLTRGKKYIIQQGINSVSVNNSHFDLRVHMMRVNGKWSPLGMCGKLAAPGKIVTNWWRGGKILPVDVLFTDELGYSPETKDTVLKNIEEFSIQTAEAVGKMYPSNFEFGLDIGIDQDQKLWLFEANINPQIKDLYDKTTYNTIRMLRKILS